MLPAGTVTLLFTDIEGSTRLLQRLGDGYGEVAAEHRRLLRDAFTGAGGHEIDTQGDAFFFTFGRARDAVAGALAGQRALRAHEWPDGVEVKVRMGLHTGEPAAGDEGYVGLDVVRAARIAAAAHGGQILLSETTSALLSGSVELKDLGEHRLKDIDRPDRLFQVVAADLPSSFPAPRTGAPPALGLDDRLEQRINAYVERTIARAFEPAPPGGRVGRPKRDVDDTIVGLVLLCLVLIGIALLVKVAFF